MVDRIFYKGAEYVLALQSAPVLTKVHFNRVLEVLEINMPQAVMNSLGPDFHKNWGEFSTMWFLSRDVLKALKSKKTPAKVLPELIFIEKAIQQAKKIGIKKFIFFKLFTTKSKSSKCYSVGVRHHEKFHAFVDVLRERHRLYKKKPQGRMVAVIDLCRDALRQYTSDSGEDAVSVILKKMPSALGEKGWVKKWVSLVDINLWRLQKLLPKDVAAKYTQATGLNLFAEELFADLSAYESTKNMGCQGYYSTYSEEGVEQIIALGLTLKTVIRELLNTKAAAKEILDFVIQSPGVFK